MQEIVPVLHNFTQIKPVSKPYQNRIKPVSSPYQARIRLYQRLYQNRVCPKASCSLLTNAQHTTALAAHEAATIG